MKNTIIITAIILLLLMTTTSQAEKLIIQFEGKKLKPYKDIGGMWTVGYGSTFNYDQNRPVIETDIISEQTALKWLKQEIQNKQAEIKKLIKVPVTQNQLDSLTSLAYNIGSGAFKNSTLLKLLNTGSNKLLVADQFLVWNKVNKKPVAGLTKRRQMERELFLK